MQKPLLTVDAVRFAYGDLTVVWDVSFELRPGHTCGLVGRNGAGKSTLLMGLAGLLRARAGSVSLDGADITRLRPHERVSRGLAFVPEGKRIFRDMTVEENLLVGTFSGRVSQRQAALLDEMYQRFPVLSDRRQSKAGSLSGGQQQMLAIAQALVTRPRALMLDEPSSGLSPVVVEEVYNAIEGLKRDGYAIILVEQNIEKAISGVVDDVVLIDNGRVVLADSAGNLTAEQLIERAALG